MRNSIMRWAIVVLCLVALGACSSKTIVPLQYSLVTPAAGSCAEPVTVLVFQDGRGDQSIGRDGDGNRLQAGSDVADWVGWAAYEQLNAAGCSVQYRSVRPPKGGALVTGDVLDVRLVPSGTTTWKALVKVRLIVERHGKKIPAETFVAEVEKPVIFGVVSREDLLNEALQGVMEQLVPKALALLRQ